MRNEAEIWAARWGVPVAVALLAIAVRAVLSTERATLLGLSRTILGGLFVGALTNLYLVDSGLSDGVRGAVVGGSALIAEDVVLAVLRLARRLREDPLTAVHYVFAAFGRTPPEPRKPDEPKQ